MYGSTNVNPETGIRYSVFSLHSLTPEMADALWMTGTNVSEETAIKDINADAVDEAGEVEEGVAQALRETDYHLIHDPNYDAILEGEIEAAYERLGYRDREHFIESKVQTALDHLQIEEPVIEGKVEGVKYAISWLGGAPNLWVFESPVVGTFRLCSPCCPNACDGNNSDPFGYEGYDVPAYWKEELK